MPISLVIQIQVSESKPNIAQVTYTINTLMASKQIELILEMLFFKFKNPQKNL
jgi:hypothetical protein